MNQNSFFSNFLLFLTVLTGFVFFAHDYLELPDWLQVAGRMHPMVLHFPIALLTLLGLGFLFKNKIGAHQYQQMLPYLTGLTAITSVISALMGLFLSTESGYGGAGVVWHKNLGSLLALLTVILYFTSIGKESIPKQLLFKSALFLSIPLLLVGSHQGANITHGADFILEPIKKQEEIVWSGSVYEDHVVPILKDNCLSCHNSDKTKGELNLESYAKLKLGGKNGPVVAAGNLGESPLIQRILLPLEHDDHMPPKGKQQPDNQGIELLKAWIEAGAQEHLTLDSLPKDHTLYKLVEAKLNKQGARSHTFDPVSDQVIQNLNGPFIYVNPLFSGSPALEAAIFVRKMYDPEYLESLGAIKDNIVKLYLRDLPITDKDLGFIATFNHLEELILNETDITGESLSELNKNIHLHKLSLSDTELNRQDLESLANHPALQEIFIWNTSISVKDLEELKKMMPQITFHLGIAANSLEPIALSPPILKNKKSIVQTDEEIVLEHQIPNTKIVYTLDGSDPSDSSSIYTGPIHINDFTILKTKAVKEGWLPSETAAYPFYVSGIPIEDLVLVNQPAKQYTSQGANTLIDQQKGDINNFGNNTWLGYQDLPFAAMIDLGDNHEPIEKIILSYGQNIGSYIMPPTRVEVLAGNRKDQLKRIKQIRLPPAHNKLDNGEVAFPIELGKTDFQYYQVNAYPVKVLPSWHPGAGDKGWVFVDELFVY